LTLKFFVRNYPTELFFKYVFIRIKTKNTKFYNSTARVAWIVLKGVNLSNIGVYYVRSLGELCVKGIEAYD